MHYFAKILVLSSLLFAAMSVATTAKELTKEQMQKALFPSISSGYAQSFGSKNRKYCTKTLCRH
ncbi:hypothetical protein BBC0244_011360 [Bartonella apihabitans]|nr:hypothetical protein BBC0244_011360 [Bartonella apihabitans]